VRSSHCTRWGCWSKTCVREGCRSGAILGHCPECGGPLCGQHANGLHDDTHRDPGEMVRGRFL
jgi:hypothetical protein